MLTYHQQGPLKVIALEMNMKKITTTNLNFESRMLQIIHIQIYISQGIMNYLHVSIITYRNHFNEDKSNTNNINNDINNNDNNSKEIRIMKIMIKIINNSNKTIVLSQGIYIYRFMTCTHLAHNYHSCWWPESFSNHSLWAGIISDNHSHAQIITDNLIDN